MSTAIPHEAWARAGEILQGFPHCDSCANAVCAILAEVAPLIVEANNRPRPATRERWPGDPGGVPGKGDLMTLTSQGYERAIDLCRRIVAVLDADDGSALIVGSLLGDLYEVLNGCTPSAATGATTSDEKGRQ